MLLLYFATIVTNGQGEEPGEDIPDDREEPGEDISKDIPPILVTMVHNGTGTDEQYGEFKNVSSIADLDITIEAQMTPSSACCSGDSSSGEYACCTSTVLNYYTAALN